MPIIIVGFHPPPRLHFSGDIQGNVLTLPAERIEIFARLGVPYSVMLHFNGALSRKKAVDFLVELKKYARFCHIVVGPDHCFGWKKQGNIDFLKSMEKSLNYQLTVCQEVEYQGYRVSSSIIRQKLKDGDLPTATALLGRPYCIMGRVSRGRGLGRKLGFPTANLLLPPAKLLPPDGVYSADIRIGEMGPIGAGPGGAKIAPEVEAEPVAGPIGAGLGGAKIAPEVEAEPVAGPIGAGLGGAKIAPEVEAEPVAGPIGAGDRLEKGDIRIGEMAFDGLGGQLGKMAKGENGHEKSAHKALVYIGSAPTVGGNKKRVEVHLLGISGDFYRQRFVLWLNKRIRGDKKFDSLEELKEEIQRDLAIVEKAGIKGSGNYKAGG